MEYAEDPESNIFPVNVPHEFDALRIFEEDDVDEALAVDDLTDHAATVGVETRSQRLRSDNPSANADITSNAQTEEENAIRMEATTQNSAHDTSSTSTSVIPERVVDSKQDRGEHISTTAHTQDQQGVTPVANDDVRGELADPTDSGEEASQPMTADLLDEEIYNYFDQDQPSENGHLQKITNHRWTLGNLQVRIQWDTGNQQWIDAKIVKLDAPLILARYIRANPVDRTRSGHWATWAIKTIETINRTIRRMHRLYNISQSEDSTPVTDLPYRKARRLNDGKRKKRTRNRPQPTLKYGVEVPSNVKQALEFDKKNGNQAWAEAIEKEMSSLYRLNCFKFHTKWKPPSNYHYK
ncbi:MAG: hypothetical protein ACREBR_02925 [bacterium]